MPFENANHINELNASSPTTSDDPWGTNAIYLELQQIKGTLVTDFANIGEAVTASAAELNYLDLTTLGSAEASKALTVSASSAIDCSGITWTNLGTVTAGTLAAATITTATINGGTVDSTTIGATTPSSGAFTTLTASTSLALASGATITAILDEDDLTTDSATAIATQQSIKAYVDAVDSYYTVTHEIADVSTAETVYVPIPVAGTVVRMDTCLQGAITVADATVTLVQSNDSAMASVTVANAGSAAGDVDTDNSITNAAVTAGSYLKLATDGGSSTAAKLLATITIQTDTI